VFAAMLAEKNQKNFLLTAVDGIRISVMPSRAREKKILRANPRKKT
jgi:hypothetical protein